MSILPKFFEWSMAERFIFYWFRLIYAVLAVQILSQNQIPVIVVAITVANFHGDRNVMIS
ncbi:hypothetical protein [Pseudanabaena yagii]|uniref:MFS transporter n=1 Tax=Pseudanabaena yagii GIHE-NHR1 TaxID=2722753 RepID=A0ABX1LZB0_9CYAN|nr:hypothetical protein [Pseudanabaena yagii]NMF60315.1 hypothetical protein [Pseudanabaena yagii GIHE-NHR1]